MNKVLMLSVGFIGLFSVTSIVFAMPNVDRVPATNNKADHGVIIPEHAVSVADNVFSLGEATDPQSGKLVEGYLIVHPRQGSKKPDGTPGGGNGNGGNGGGNTGGGGETSSCYGFLAKDTKWKSVENWVVDPANNEGLNENDVFTILDAAITKWEDAADGTVDGDVSFNILGNGSASTSFAAAGILDGVNGVRFGNLDSGTIGVTSVWGIFGGKPSGRELVEWDQVYNTDFTWNTDGNADDMDFESIATHEIGHSFGMDDLYTIECSEETMYGYGDKGEIYARDLNIGDITGISKLY